MAVNEEIDVRRPYWFVGATYGGTDDQSERFLREGIWENGYKDKYLDEVKSIKPGDRIAIKSTFTQKHGLPFDNRGHTVSGMYIKAIGTVKENLDNGRRLVVDWERLDPPRKWYFYTNRRTIWKVVPGNWKTDALIAFTFYDRPQDIEQFRNAPYWKDRFGDVEPKQRSRFQWTQFYEALADKLLDFKDDRQLLVMGIHDIAKRVEALTHLTDQFPDGETGPLKDICPFTTIGIFNRHITDENRKTIARELAAFLGLEERVPDSFEGIPLLNNQRSWFFGYEKDRKTDDIDVLWNVFEYGLRLASEDDADIRETFSRYYNDAITRYSVSWNLTMGLYWTRPWYFPTLDTKSRKYINDKLNVKIASQGEKGVVSASKYLSLRDELENRFEETGFPVHSFPELSLAAWQHPDIADTQGEYQSGGASRHGSTIADKTTLQATQNPYSLKDIITDGSFLSFQKLQSTIERLIAKKNIVLQGPPGTGKTWLAKRLAYALVGRQDNHQVRVVQFHPNLSYEDFIRGYRPTSGGQLDMVDGPFLEMVASAISDPDERYVIVVEEINRGHPAQVFGEMLTLLEADKRSPANAMGLTYRKTEHERIYVPENLYVIGTMNIADRSLALVDFALRRRFAFIELEPVFGEIWRDWVHDNTGIDHDILREIEIRILNLNTVIESDPNLGEQFRIGHSYFTPSVNVNIADAREWFRQVVETEIGPLLEEYWFDNPDKAKEEVGKLLRGF